PPLPPPHPPPPYTTLFRSSVHQTPPSPRWQMCSHPCSRYSVSAQLGSAATPRWLATSCTIIGVSSTLRSEAGSTPAGSRKDVKIDRKSTRLNSSHVKISYA